MANSYIVSIYLTFIISCIAMIFRYWFDCPTKNRDVLNQRHEAISFFYHDCNLDAGRCIRNLLKDIMSCKVCFIVLIINIFLFLKIYLGNCKTNEFGKCFNQ